METRIILFADLMAEVEKEPELIYEVLSVAMRGLENYRKEMVKKNAQIDLIVRNLKPEYYEELKKYVIPEIFENLGLTDAIKTIESSTPPPSQ